MIPLPPHNAAIKQLFDAAGQQPAPGEIETLAKFCQMTDTMMEVITLSAAEVLDKAIRNAEHDKTDAATAAFAVCMRTALKVVFGEQDMVKFATFLLIQPQAKGEQP